MYSRLTKTKIQGRYNMENLCSAILILYFCRIGNLGNNLCHLVIVNWTIFKFKNKIIIYISLMYFYDFFYFKQVMSRRG